jgi:hypothetical protein
MQKPVPSAVLASSAVMPADEPSGRGMDVQPALVTIGSPTAPVVGLSASQLYSLAPDLCEAL